MSHLCLAQCQTYQTNGIIHKLRSLPWRCLPRQSTLHQRPTRSLRTMARHKGPRKPPGQKKPPLTHFLCLPLITPTSRPQLEASLKSFREDVSPHDQPSDSERDAETVRSTIHPKAIRPVGALHCTLGVMSLDEDRLQEAVECLKGIDIASLLQGTISEATRPQHTIPSGDSAGGNASRNRHITPPPTSRPVAPVSISLKGLVSMHAPHNTSILYTAPTDPTSRVYPFCLALQKVFKDRGFLVPDDRQLKLHATIVNTIYAKGKKMPFKPGSVQQAGDDRSQGHGPNANAPLKIDARDVLERYEDFVWAESVVLDRVAICEMGAKKILDGEGNVKGEEYSEVASVALPS